MTSALQNTLGIYEKAFLSDMARIERRKMGAFIKPPPFAVLIISLFTPYLHRPRNIIYTSMLLMRTRR
jgi:hypothetical protein